jgi:hypothetical protein
MAIDDSTDLITWINPLEPAELEAAVEPATQALGAAQKALATAEKALQAEKQHGAALRQQAAVITGKARAAHQAAVDYIRVDGAD